jgi:hypothetical protein
MAAMAEAAREAEAARAAEALQEARAAARRRGRVRVRQGNLVTPSPDGAPTPCERHRLMTANLATCIHYGEIKDPCKMEIPRLDLATRAYVPAKAARKIWASSTTCTNPNTMSYSASPQGVANTILDHLS